MATALRSKTGCLTCRRRHVKCDEVRPSCARCRKAAVQCAWSGQPAALRHVDLSTIIGNTYATLYLRSERFDFAPTDEPYAVQLCPTKSLSSGYIPFRTQNEHDSFAQLSGYLSMLGNTHRQDTKPHFEFCVALQELWIRDAVLGTAATILPASKSTVNVDPRAYYTSASGELRYQLTQQPTESRLEQSLIASLFLGMIEASTISFRPYTITDTNILQISEPENTGLPLLHFEAAGRILQRLQDQQTQQSLPENIALFHSRALEVYLYNMSIQSLFYPRADQPPTLSPMIRSLMDLPLHVQSRQNTIIAMDVSIYVVLFELTQLARQKELTDSDKLKISKIDRGIGRLQQNVREQLARLSGTDLQHESNFCHQTNTAARVLSIFSMKVADRKLTCQSQCLRQPVQLALSDLKRCKPSRRYTGNFTWMFAILACAISTVEETLQLTQKLQQLSSGLWGANMRRIKRVLKTTRNLRIRRVSKEHSIDPLDMLVEGRLSMVPCQMSCIEFG